MQRIIVIGGGASGMIAAYSAASNGKSVTLIEKNEKLGKKIYITGKGRCNLTNDLPVEDFFKFVVSNPKFTYSCINAFSPHDTMSFFENNGLSLKTERGNRVFPLSDKASDVTKTLEKALKINGVEIILNTAVVKILTDNKKVLGVLLDNGKKIDCDGIIVCTGGNSYTSTGSTGDGYNFAKENGHKIIPLKPALVGIELKGDEFVSLQGQSLKNVSLTAKLNEKTIYNDFGEMLFTHFGISGPIVLSCSSIINKFSSNEIYFYIDLKPALDTQTLDNRLVREFSENNVKELSNVMRSLLPKALIQTVLRQAQVKQSKKCSEITQLERQRIIHALKNLKFEYKKLRPLQEAIVTSGGVCVKEINPKTMQSKLVEGLSFAGEVLDIDAFTGGFNLQLAFSTGYVAGKNI